MLNGWCEQGGGVPVDTLLDSQSKDRPRLDWATRCEQMKTGADHSPDGAGGHDPLRIEDIARAAGVSVSTVSRILNNHRDVSARTRSRVLDLIEATGYAPHPHARRLASGKSDTIALVYPFTSMQSDDNLLEFIVAANEVAVAERFFFNLSTHNVTREHLLSIYGAGHVGGVILMQICLHDWRVELLKRHRLPFVMIGRTNECEDLWYVDVDFEKMLQSIFDLLTSLGHRTIGYLARPEALRKQGFGPAVREMRGYEAAIEKHGLSSNWISTESSVASCYDATRDLLRRIPRLTAIVTTWGQGVAGVIEALRHARRRIPEDVSVISADSTEKAALSTFPTLTSIQLPAGKLGSCAAEMLVRILKENPPTPEHLILVPEISKRGSTAPPP